WRIMSLMSDYEEARGHFGAETKKILDLSKIEAQSRNHLYIGTEHLLLGLLKLKENKIVRFFTNLGFHYELTSQEVEIAVGTGPEIQNKSENYTLTPRARMIMIIAYRESVNQRQNEIRLGHVLIALLIEPNGSAAKVLKA